MKPFRPPGSLLGTHEELASVGWGFDAQISKRVSTRLTLAYAPNRLPTKHHNYRIHFQLAASLL